MNAPVHACIGLGANLGDAAGAVRASFAALDALPGSRLLARSRLYRTPAWGRTDQPDFINAAAVLETVLTPQALLQALLEIERGRSEEHTSELQSREKLVCRLLL